MSTLDPEIDLTACDREPIHIPGGIQPHGWLLAMEEPSLRVLYASENLAELTGAPATTALGAALDEIVGAQAALRTREVLAGDLPELAELDLQLGEHRLTARVHRHAGVALLELEPERPVPRNLYRTFEETLGRLHRQERIEDLLSVATEEVSRLTGLDRVMVYRFDADGNGEVVAETLRHDLSPYLGLRYPATDIPAQARDLYRRNRLRLIPDSHAAPSPIVPGDHGAPLDLSYAVLRAVSPIHLEYMRNMGARGSMTIALVVRDELWGLVTALAHDAPAPVPRAVRDACRTVGRMLSLQVGALEALRVRDERRASHGSIEQVLSRARERHSVDDGLVAGAAALEGLVPSDGVAIVINGRAAATRGHLPPIGMIESLARHVHEAGEPVFSTNELSRRFPPINPYRGVASGLLALSMTHERPIQVLWFRCEQAHTVQWGGEPGKAVDASSGRIRPRRSFEAWKQVVQGRSQPWSQGELEVATDLRRRLIEVDLGHQIRAARAAVRARDDLVAIVSHDLKNPLSIISLHADLISRLISLGAPQEQLHDALARVHRATSQMSTLIGDLLDLGRLEAGRFELDRRRVPGQALMHDVVKDLRPLAEAQGIELVVEPASEPVELWVDPKQIERVFVNIVGNSLKFTPAGGRVSIRQESIDGFVRYEITDTGAGMPTEELEHLFDRYWQSRPEAQRGSGLGLYIVHGIIKEHGGRIEAESAPGKGTTLRFELPRV